MNRVSFYIYSCSSNDSIDSTILRRLRYARKVYPPLNGHTEASSSSCAEQTKQANTPVFLVSHLCFSMLSLLSNTVRLSVTAYFVPRLY